MMKRLSFLAILTLVAGISTPIRANVLNNEANLPKVSSSLLLAAKTNSGSFVGVDHPTQGRVNIVEENGIKYLEIDQNFKTDRGPDLKIILHNSAKVDAKVKSGEYVSLGKLKAFNGSQRYQLPQDLNLDDYQSVAIWCEQYNVTFGYATL